MAARDKPDLDEIIDVLTHRYRRYILYHLTHDSEAVDFDKLVSSLDNWEADQNGKIRNGSRTSVEIQLHHVHLPKLVEAGVITFDAETGSIELAETKGQDQLIATVAGVEGYTQPSAGD